MTTQQLWTTLRGEEQTILFPIVTKNRSDGVYLSGPGHGTESRHGDTILRFMEAPDFTPECTFLERLTGWETETTTTT